jgi:hypothetical protein
VVHPEDSDVRDARSSLATTANFGRAEDPSFCQVSSATGSELQPSAEFGDAMKIFMLLNIIIFTTNFICCRA